MTIERADALYESPNPLAQHYQRFRVAERLLLTGHSHQAWPDRAALGQARAWDDAAEHVDDKWQRAFERAERVREGFARLLEASPSQLSLGESTHALIVRWLSALPLSERPCIVTTDAEFHSLRGLLERLEMRGLRVVRVAARPAESVGARLAAAVGPGVAAVMTSSVFFGSAEIAGELTQVARSCERHGAELLLDVYHQLNVVPLSLRALAAERAYVVGGGYKYCQLGEGNAFLCSPPDSQLEPALAGWYADFEALEARAAQGRALAPLRSRFAGATYDPTSHYRAAEVFAFFAEQGLSAALLREVSQHQVGLLRAEIDALGLPETRVAQVEAPLERIAGFVALRIPGAIHVQRELALRGLACDARGDTLRLGPAPYLSDLQLRDAVGLLGEVLRGP